MCPNESPVDWKIQDYGLFVKEFPFVLGTDVAGVVHAVGKNVTKFKKGDRVLGHAISLASQQNSNGGFQLYTTITANFAAIVPEKISFAHATVLPLAIDTAGQGKHLHFPISHKAQAYPGDMCRDRLA